MRLRRSAPVAVAVMLAALLAGCGGGGGGGSSSGSVSASANSLNATPTPNSAVKTVVGSTAAVAVVFTSSDGRPVSNVQVPLTQLPAGWTAPSSAFSCSQAATGNGCMLNLSYKPTSVTSGSVPLSYAYDDGAGTAKSGSVTISYAATSANNAVATVSPSGQVTAMAGSGTQSVSINFTTDDGNPATNLQVTTNLAALPDGWTSSASTFSCASFATGSGCQLPLAFAPTTTADTGALAIAYSYLDNAGATKTGTATVPYLTTGDNNVVGSFAPNGQVVGLVDSGSQDVVLSFVTDNTQSASNLLVTTNLAALPVGWTAATAPFSCATVGAANACVLHFAYAPTQPASGTLSIAYSFTSSTGDNKTGTATIAYTTTPGHTYVADFGGNQILRCAMSASTGALSGCASILSVPSPRTVTFHGGYAYIPSFVANTLNGNPVNTLTVCPVQNDGSFATAGCAATGFALGFSFPSDVEFNGNTMYVPQHGSSVVQVCTIGAQGLPSSCSQTATFAGGGSFSAPTSITFRGATAYVADQWYLINGALHGAIVACTLDPGTGALTGCTQATAFASPNPVAVTLQGSYLYVGTDTGTSVCTLNADNTLGACSATNPAIGNLPLPPTSTTTNDYGIATVNGYFYVGDHANGDVWICPAAAGGAIGRCAAAGITVTSPTGITVY